MYKECILVGNCHKQTPTHIYLPHSLKHINTHTHTQTNLNVRRANHHRHCAKVEGLQELLCDIVLLDAILKRQGKLDGG
jgi:hypothetical protein